MITDGQWPYLLRSFAKAGDQRSNPAARKDVEEKSLRPIKTAGWSDGIRVMTDTNWHGARGGRVEQLGRVGRL